MVETAQPVTGQQGAAEVVPRGPWVLFLITGLIWTWASLVILRFNTQSITTVGVIVGIYFLMATVNEFVIAAVVEGWKWLHWLMAVLFGLGALWAFFEPKEAFWALASVIGFILVFKGMLDIITATATKGVNPLWGVGLTAGILELLLGFWASQRFYPARAELVLLWVGFAALFRGIAEITLAFHVRQLSKSG
jgi:uncharacterized membrane protein HdeD (DUF308 family)